MSAFFKLCNKEENLEGNKERDYNDLENCKGMTKLCKGEKRCIKALDCQRWFADQNGKGSRRRKKKKRKKKKKKEKETKKKKEKTREDIDKESSPQDVQNREGSERTKYKTQVYLTHQIHFTVHNSTLKKRLWIAYILPNTHFPSNKEDN